jgi:TPR repeat protein
MQYRRRRNVALVLGILLAGTRLALSDGRAGTEAFRNKDYPRAFREWKVAAEAGQAEAQFDLGVLFAQGLGVQRDLTEAARWYQKAADQGNAEAQFALGQMYSRGWGAPRDEIDALRWFQMASDPSSEGPPTEWALIEGYGIAKDERQAAYWYQKAAEQGHVEAEYNLGRLYATGEGVPRDQEQALRWIRAAASQGYAPAQARFGIRYARGNGIAQDHRLAYFWMTLARLHGDKSVEKLRTAEAAKLAPEVVASTDQAAQNWKPRAMPAGKR